MAIESKILSPNETTDDLAFAQALGFKPGSGETVDLDEPPLPFDFSPVPLPNAAPVFKNPASEFTPTPNENARRLSDALSSKKLTASADPAPVADEKVDIAALRDKFIKISEAPTVLTNKDALLSAPKYTMTQIGKIPYPCDYNDINFDGARIDNICGALPYQGEADFTNGIFVGEFTIPIAAKIDRAIQAKSMTLFLDAMALTTNVPYRRLTVVDHYQLMYYHLINDFPAMAIPVNWKSAIYGVQGESTASAFHISESFFTMPQEEWNNYAAKGFTLPRVYDLEAADALDQIDGGEYVLDILKWLDPRHPNIIPYVRKAAERKSPSPRLQGRIDFLADQKVRFTAELNEFKEAVARHGLTMHGKEFTGITESVSLKVDPKSVTISSALEYLGDIVSRTPEQEREYSRLRAIFNNQYSKIEERNSQLVNEEASQDKIDDEIQKMTTDLLALTFDPETEEVPLTRNQWSFFPFI